MERHLHNELTFSDVVMKPNYHHFGLDTTFLAALQRFFFDPFNLFVNHRSVGNCSTLFE
jgi:hypothetical protein